MSLQGTLELYIQMERKTEQLLHLHRQVTALRQERDELRSLITLFKEGLSLPRFWMRSGDLFVRTDKAAAFQTAVQRLEAVLRLVKQAETSRHELAEELTQHANLGTVAGEPEVLRVLSEVLEED